MFSKVGQSSGLFLSLGLENPDQPTLLGAAQRSFQNAVVPFLWAQKPLFLLLHPRCMKPLLARLTISSQPTLSSLISSSAWTDLLSIPWLFQLFARLLSAWEYRGAGGKWRGRLGVLLETWEPQTWGWEVSRQCRW